MDNILSHEEASKYWDLSNLDRPVWVKDSGNRFGKVVGLGYFETREEAEVVSSKHRLSYLEDLYGIYKCSVDEKVWDALREIHTP